MIFTNSSIPYLESSLPNPLFLIPPNGTLGSETTTLLTDTIPDFMLLDNNSAFSRSCVQILAPRPNWESFASFIPSFSLSTIRIGAIGPNTSSFTTLIFGAILPRIVGL